MLSRVLASSRPFAARALPQLGALRFFEADGKIPDANEQSFGRRKMELDAEERGEILFNRDPIVPPDGAGTKENPILVPSEFDERVVGFEDPQVHQLQWFNLKEGALYYVPILDKYFKLYPIEDAPVVTVDHH